MQKISISVVIIVIETHFFLSVFPMYMRTKVFLVFFLAILLLLRWLSIVVIVAQALSGLDSLRLLVVIECLALASNLFDLLMVHIVNLDDIVDQVMVKVVVLDHDALRVPVVTVHVGYHGLRVLMVNSVLFHHRLERIKVLRYCLVHCRLLVLQVLDFAARCRRLLVAAQIRRRQLQVANVNRGRLLWRVALECDGIRCLDAAGRRALDSSEAGRIALVLERGRLGAGGGSSC